MLAQQNITAQTPLGANLVASGATFRLWAPEARNVYLNGIFGGQTFAAQTPDRLLSNDGQGFWTGFQDGAQDGDRYRFWVEGAGGAGYKRDPYARELDPANFPNCFCILREGNSFPWHDQDYKTPDYADMVVYQLHVGTYAVSRPGTAANLLDVACKIPYLAALGINVLQPLPIDEQEANPNMGYGGADIFSPDFPYVVTTDLPNYLVSINQLYAARQIAPIALTDIQSGPGQLRVLVDLCHVHGIAVAFDVVYNHAGGFSIDGQLDDQCLYYLDRRANKNDNNDSLYFTDQDRGSGGLAFALWNDVVANYLVDNALYYIDEFHADGFRYDEISALISTGQSSAWAFCRTLTSTLRARKSDLLQNAEFWPGEFGDIPSTAFPVFAPAAAGGMGFDAVQHDGLRSTVRDAVAAASAGADAPVSMANIASALYPSSFDHAWRAVTCIENHDLVYQGRSPRVPALADASNRRSWYARSRTRAAMGILLTGPGIPQLFMGQEFLEDKPWNDDPGGSQLIWWGGLLTGTDPAMSDHLRFSRELIQLRHDLPALRSDQVHAFHVSDADRVMAYHRWIEGVGQDVIVVASFAEATRSNYRIGFPAPGFWAERFNSDVYDHWVNPWVAGNEGGVTVDGDAMHGFQTSAAIVIPANSIVVFVKA